MNVSKVFEGLVVLDLTRYVAGPYCTMLLADHGAEVIKIEPIGGEDTRKIVPKIGPDGGGVSVYFARFNRNKRSVCVDLRSPDGKQILADLVRTADVLVENFRPGVLARLGFDGETLKDLNERLIYLSISGFGHTSGPLRDRPAFAPIAEAMAGVVRFNPPGGEPPLSMGLSIGDLFPGALSVAAVSMALLERSRTGVGTHIDMSMYDAMISLNERAVLFSAMLGANVQPGAPALTSTPSGVFRASDGYICMSVVGESMWARFCNVLQRTDLISDERLGSGPARALVYDEVLAPVIDEWLGQRTRAQAVAELLTGGVPAGEVRSVPEVVTDEHAAARQMIVNVPTYAGIDVIAAGNPIRLGGVVSGLDSSEVRAPGQDTVQVLTELGHYSSEAVSRLVENGTVGVWAPAPAPGADAVDAPQANLA